MLKNNHIDIVICVVILAIYTRFGAFVRFFQRVVLCCNVLSALRCALLRCTEIAETQDSAQINRKTFTKGPYSFLCVVITKNSPSGSPRLFSVYVC